MICLVFLFLCSFLTHACDTLDEVTITLQLKWLLQAQFAGYVAAEEMGFYGDECININIRPGGSYIDPVGEIVSGRSQVAITWLSQAVVAKSQGLNITLLAQIFRRAATLEITWKDTGYATLPSLAGKHVCVWNGGNENDLRVALNMYNMTWDSYWEEGLSNGSIDIVQQGVDMSAFINRLCDAAAAMRYNELAQVLMTTDSNDQLYTMNDLNIIDFNVLGTALLEDCIVVDSNWLEENEDLAVRFLKASFKGWMYCRDYPDECTNFFIDNGPLQSWQMTEVNKLIWPATTEGIGDVNDSLLQHTADVAYEFALIDQPLNASDGLLRRDLVHQAQAMLVSTDWAPTEYGPGSGDYVAANYEGDTKTFCLDGTSTVILCPPIIDLNPNSYINYSDAAGIFLVLLTVLSLILVVIVGVLIVINREHDVIKASSWIFCLYMCIGGFLALLQTFTVLGEPTDAKCNIRPFLLGIGFILTFGSFCIKTYRIHKIFNNEHLRMIYNLTDGKLSLRLLVFILIESLLLIVLATAGSITAEKEQYSYDQYVLECQVNNGSNILTSIFVLNSLLLFVGVYFAWSTREVRTAYNESKYLAFSIYSLVLSIIIIVPTITTDMALDTAQLIQTLGVIVSVLGSLGCLFIPKLYIMATYEKWKATRSETNTSSHLSMPQLVEMLGDHEHLALASTASLKAQRDAFQTIVEKITKELDQRKKTRSAIANGTMPKINNSKRPNKREYSRTPEDELIKRLQEPTPLGVRNVSDSTETGIQQTEIGQIPKIRHLTDISRTDASTDPHFPSPLESSIIGRGDPIFEESTFDPILIQKRGISQDPDSPVLTYPQEKKSEERVGFLKEERSSFELEADIPSPQTTNGTRSTESQPGLIESPQKQEKQFEFQKKESQKHTEGIELVRNGDEGGLYVL